MHGHIIYKISNCEGVHGDIIDAELARPTHYYIRVRYYRFSLLKVDLCKSAYIMVLSANVKGKTKTICYQKLDNLVNNFN